MPVYRDADFDKFSSEVVDRFLSGQSKLADAAAEMAMQHQMNPDQVQQLIQAANTLTFLRMMNQQKQQGSPDLMQEFEPASPDDVLRVILQQHAPEASPQMGQPNPMEMQHELPDEMAQVRGDMDGDGDLDTPEEAEVEKEVQEAGGTHEDAEEAAHGKRKEKKAPPNGKKEPAEKPEKKPSKEASIMKLRKVASGLKDRRLQTEYHFEEVFDKLAHEFKRIYGPSYDEFEKSAMAEYGDAAVPVLNSIREQLRKGPIESTNEKIASLKNHISEETNELKMLEILLTDIKQAEECDKALMFLTKEVPGL